MTMDLNHPSYRPSTTIAEDPEGWRVTRKVGDEKFRLYGRYTSLGDVAAMIRKAHRACTSRWKVNGVEVSGAANAHEIAGALGLPLIDTR